MANLNSLQRQLAEAYDHLRRDEREYAERKAEFDKVNLRLTCAISDKKTLIESLREQISGIILEQFMTDGTRPDYPLAIQVRSTPRIYDPQNVMRWAFVNEEFSFFKLDEKVVKDYLKDSHRIVDEVGEVLASMVEEPIPQIGEKTLLSWMQEQSYVEGKHEEA